MKKDKINMIKDLSRRLVPMRNMIEKVVENKKKKYVRSTEKSKFRNEVKQYYGRWKHEE